LVLRSTGCGRRRDLRAGGGVRSLTASLVWRLRLLAYQPKFLPDALRRFACHSGVGLRLVPMGTAAFCLQSAGPAGPDVLAGLLGPHRICVRPIFDLAERAVQRGEGDAGTGRYCSGHARLVEAPNAL